MCRVMDQIREEGKLEERLSSIRNIMNTMKLSAKQAMEALRIPESEWDYCLKHL